MVAQHSKESRKGRLLLGLLARWLLGFVTTDHYMVAPTQQGGGNRVFVPMVSLPLTGLKGEEKLELVGQSDTEKAGEETEDPPPVAPRGHRIGGSDTGSCT